MVCFHMWTWKATWLAFSFKSSKEFACKNTTHQPQHSLVMYFTSMESAWYNAFVWATYKPTLLFSKKKCLVWQWLFCLKQYHHLVNKYWPISVPSWSQVMQPRPVASMGYVTRRIIIDKTFDFAQWLAHWRKSAAAVHIVGILYRVIFFGNVYIPFYQNFSEQSKVQNESEHSIKRLTLQVFGGWCYSWKMICHSKAPSI